MLLDVTDDNAASLIVFVFGHKSGQNVLIWCFSCAKLRSLYINSTNYRYPLCNPANIGQGHSFHQARSSLADRGVGMEVYTAVNRICSIIRGSSLLSVGLRASCALIEHGQFGLLHCKMQGRQKEMKVGGVLRYEARSCGRFISRLLGFLSLRKMQDGTEFPIIEHIRNFACFCHPGALCIQANSWRKCIEFEKACFV